MDERVSDEEQVSEKEQRREQILVVAASAIAEHGFHGMSMRKLAQATQRSLASFYNYFASKDEVLLALHTRAFDTLISTARQALAEAEDPVAQLYLFIANHVGYFIQHSEVMRVLVQEASTLPPPQRRIVRELKEGYFDLAREVVQRIVSEHGARGDDGCVMADGAEIERATYCLFGMMNWVFGWYEAEQHGQARDVAHTIHRLALSGLVTAGSPSSVRDEMDRRIASGALPSPLRRRPNGEHAAA